MTAQAFNQRWLFTVVKRVMDVLGAIVALVLLLPFLALVSLSLLVCEGRPVFFSQQRLGLGSRPFTLLKFRTMWAKSPANTEDDSGRVSPLGRVLRALSIDELPSLWNILKGDMSFVGPRPLLLDYEEILSPRHARRHEVRPGLTGLAQVSGRNHLSWKERLDLDLHYAVSSSIRMDFMILARTPGVVASTKGVYNKNGVIMERLAADYDSGTVGGSSGRMTPRT